MAISRQKKEEILKELNDAFSTSQVAVFTDFKNMKVSEVDKLRRSVRESGGVYRVAKKTLLKKSLEEQKIEGIDPIEMEGEVGVAFGMKDPAATSKAVYQIQKEGEVLRIISGIMDGSVLDASAIMQLATLPSREELLAKVVGTINAPVSGFVGVLGGTTRKFIYALNAVAESKK